MHKINASHSKRNIHSGFEVETLLELESVSYFYGKFLALQNISFDLYEGETLFITGESGAGKSTLLKLICNQLLPSRGKLYWSQVNKPRVSWVSQNIELIEKFNLMDNLWIAFQEEIHGSYRQFENEALELAKYFDIFDKLDMPMDKANGGLRQMVTIMRALLSRPHLLVLDEPTKSLDEKNSIKAFELMSYYCTQKKMSVVWASHNRSLIKKFSGKMIHLEKGQVVYSGQACFI